MGSSFQSEHRSYLVAVVAVMLFMLAGGSSVSEARLFGTFETLTCCETLQFEDYGKVECNYFDPEERKARHQGHFPENYRKAVELGVRLADAAATAIM